MTTKERLSVKDVDPAALQAVLGLERYVRASDLEPRLLELIKIRASQLNGCAYCLDMHTRDARAQGETQRRLDVLSAWREAAGLFTKRERTALAFTESVTRIADAGVPDAVWTDLTHFFDDTQIVRLLIAVAAINVWNRIAISTHQQLPDLDPSAG
jgi:AhpD family alkylhydroperoxidase